MYDGYRISTFHFADSVQVKSRPFSFRSASKLQELVEVLPGAPQWHWTDIEPESGEAVADLTMFWRDPIECIQHLLEDPYLSQNMTFAPRRVYTSDAENKNRIYNEMWTGDWWWRMQVRTIVWLPIFFFRHKLLGGSV
jgi:hypothetical protein